jgi:hypothetical protein
MTDKEKIIRHDTLELIRKTIGGCFGSADGIFAKHPADEGRAKDMRKLAADTQITLTDIRELALGTCLITDLSGLTLKSNLIK